MNLYWQEKNFKTDFEVYAATLSQLLLTIALHCVNICSVTAAEITYDQSTYGFLLHYLSTALGTTCSLIHKKSTMMAPRFLRFSMDINMASSSSNITVTTATSFLGKTMSRLTRRQKLLTLLKQWPNEIINFSTPTPAMFVLFLLSLLNDYAKTTDKLDPSEERKLITQAVTIWKKNDAHHEAKDTSQLANFLFFSQHTSRQSIPCEIASHMITRIAPFRISASQPKTPTAPSRSFFSCYFSCFGKKETPVTAFTSPSPPASPAFGVASLHITQ